MDDEKEVKREEVLLAADGISIFDMTEIIYLMTLHYFSGKINLQEYEFVKQLILDENTRKQCREYLELLLYLEKQLDIKFKQDLRWFREDIVNKAIIKSMMTFPIAAKNDPENRFISKKVHQYLYGQLTNLILKNTFKLLEPIRVLQNKNISIKITQNTYDLLYASSEAKSRLEIFKKDLEKWLLCNNMEKLITMTIQENCIILIIDYPSMIKLKP